MYPNLKAEMARLSITAGELAKRIPMAAGTMSEKINQKSDFTLAEARKIREVLGLSEMSLDDLFMVKED